MPSVDPPRSGFAARPQRRSSRRASGLLVVSALLATLGGCATVTSPIEAAQQAAATLVAKAAAQVTPEAKPAAVAPEVLAQFERALQAQRGGRVDEAERLWRALAESHPDLGGVHANLGLLHGRAGRPAEAVAALTPAS